MATARLQRWALLLTAYSYDIEFRHTQQHTQQHANVDGLSRLPQGDQQPPAMHSVFVIGQIQVLPVTTERLEIETRHDPILSKVHTYLREGWPTNTSGDFKPFRDLQEELTTQGNVVLWGNRVVIPEKLHAKLLEELHRNHPGISRMKALAHSYVWWPHLDKDLVKCVQQCQSCQEVRNAPAAAPLHPWLGPTKPWQQIHVDFAGPFEGRMFFIGVDAHSKWPEVINMSTTTAIQTFIELRKLFAAHGLPKQLVSDNGPQFTADEFSTFCKMNSVKYIQVSPYHPSSNSQAERFVQTFKWAMKASDNQNTPLSQRLSSFSCSTAAPHIQQQATPHVSSLSAVD